MDKWLPFLGETSVNGATPPRFLGICSRCRRVKLYLYCQRVHSHQAIPENLFPRTYVFSRSFFAMQKKRTSPSWRNKVTTAWIWADLQHCSCTGAGELHGSCSGCREVDSVVVHPGGLCFVRPPGLYALLTCAVLQHLTRGVWTRAFALRSSDAPVRCPCECDSSVDMLWHCACAAYRATLAGLNRHWASGNKRSPRRGGAGETQR